MKRLIVSILAAAAFTGASWGQLFFPSLEIVSSLERNSTATLSLNEIDRSFTAYHGFGSVATPFLFAGVIGNPMLLSNVGSSGGLDLGYYQSGSLPFSAFGAFSATNRSNAIPNDSSVSSNNNTVTVVTGANSTDYIWSSTVTGRKYSLPSPVNAFSGTVQGLFSIAGMTTGLIFTDSPNWSATDAALAAARYSTVTVTNNYDTAGGGVVPVVATDYTQTTTFKNAAGAIAPGTAGSYATSSSLGFNLPFFMKTGSLEHSAFVGVGLKAKDMSATYSIATTQAANTVLGAIADVDNSVTAGANQTLINGGYAVSIPGFFGAANGNRFSAGVYVSDAITTSNYAFDLLTKNYAAGAVNTKTATNGFDSVYSASFNPANYLGIYGMVKHSINFAPVQGAFIGLEPQLVVKYTKDVNDAFTNWAGTGAGIATGTVRYVTPLDASFAYNSGTYTKTTVTIAGDAPSTKVLAFGLNLPTAFKLKPEGWAFGFFTGATPFASLAWTTTTTSGQTTTQKVDTITAGAVTGTVTTTPTVNVATSSTSLAASLGEDHSFGIFVPFQGDIRADISLNGSNLLAFESLSLQLYVPLK